MKIECQEIEHVSQPTGFISSGCLCGRISMKKKSNKLNLKYLWSYFYFVMAVFKNVAKTVKLAK